MANKHRKATYRLYPTRCQEQALWSLFHAHRALYNAALEQRIGAYRSGRISVTFAQQCRDLTELRSAEERFGAINAQSLQVTLKRVDLAFQHFFRRIREGGGKAGFPRFKGTNRWRGWGYKTHGDGWRLMAGERMRHGRIRISGVGHVRIRGCPRTEGEPKTCEVTHKNDRWYVSVTLACEPEREVGTLERGLDWGVTTFATLADAKGASEEIENPRLLRAAERDLASAQRRLSRKKRGSRNRERARRRVARLHEKVQNRRLDFLHKVSAKLVKTHRLIATETLQIRGMTATARGTAERPGKNVRQKAGLNRSVLDTAPGMFLQMLRYKAEEAGLEIVEVPTRKVKPTQRCYACWTLVPKRLGDRQHACPECGTTCGRDENAARVMIRWALAAQGREPARCGASLSEAVKHEPPSVAA